MASRMMAVIFMGLGCIFIPLVVVALTYLQGGSSWETVGQMVAVPIVAVFILGIVVLFLAEYLR